MLGLQLLERGAMLRVLTLHLTGEFVDPRLTRDRFQGHCAVVLLQIRYLMFQIRDMHGSQTDLLAQARGFGMGCGDLVKQAGVLIRNRRPQLGEPLRTLGRLSFERGDLHAAEEFLERSMMLVERWSPARALVSAAALARVWLSIGREMQLKRFHDRHHDPLKVWKLSPVDMEALPRWDAYTMARNTMLAATDKDYAPWTTIRANDKRRTRIAVMRTVLQAIDFDGKDPVAIGNKDENIVLTAKQFLKEHIAG